MFDPQRFITECDAAILAGQGSAAIRGLLAAAIADPAAIVAALGEPARAGVEVLHRSPRLTVLNLVWPPCFTQTAHDHQMWAEIGVYGGREDNIFWRRCPPDARWPIEPVGAASLLRGDLHSMRDDIIHSITNPLDKLTAALHVYGGDIFAAARHEWDGETLLEGPFHNKRGEQACEAYNNSFGAQPQARHTG